MKDENSVKNGMNNSPPSPNVPPGWETDFVVHPTLTGRAGISVNQGRRNTEPWGQRGRSTPQILTDLLILFQTGFAEYTDHITNRPLLDFHTFLRACKLMGLKGQYILRRSLS